MKLIVLCVFASLATLAAASNCRGGAGDYVDINSVTTYANLLHIAENEENHLLEQLEKVQLTFFSMLKMYQQNQQQMITFMENGPSECNKAGAVREYLQSREKDMEEQAERNIVAELLHTPVIETLKDELQETEDALRGEECRGEPCRASKKVLMQYKAWMAETRDRIRKAIDNTPQIIYKPLVDATMMTFLAEFRACTRAVPT